MRLRKIADLMGVPRDALETPLLRHALSIDPTASLLKSIKQRSLCNAFTWQRESHLHAGGTKGHGFPSSGGSSIERNDIARAFRGSK